MQRKGSGVKLTDRLPYSVTYMGKRYKLRPWFDNVLRVLEIEESTDLLESEKLDLMLYELIKGKYPLDAGLLNAATKTLFVFKSGKSEQKTMDYEQDADLIYSGMMQAYGIDLFKVQGKLHWWSFVALLNGLPDNCKLAQVLHVRVMPIPKPTKYNGEERAKIVRLKQDVALELSEEEKKKNLQAGLAKVAQCLMSMVKHENKG